MAVISSTAGYCAEIGFLQYLHLPDNETQLSTGTKSRADRLCRQFGQTDLPFVIERPGSLLPLLAIYSRHTRAFKKLPIKRPKRNISKSVINGLYPYKRKRPQRGLFLELLALAIIDAEALAVLLVADHREDTVVTACTL
jgi:hypothetical protein